MTQYDPKTDHHPKKSNPNHQTTNHQSRHVLHTNYHAMKSLRFHRCSFLLRLTFRFQSSCLSMEYQSMKSLLLRSHDSKHTREKCDQASNRWSKLHLYLFLRVKSFLFRYLCFLLFPLLLPRFPFMKVQWPNPFPLLLLFPLKYPLPFSAPMSMGASPEPEEVKMCLLLKYCTRVFLICSYVWIAAAFNRRCCWSAPEFIKVATSMLSGIGVPVCCSYLAFTVSQALRSCSKVCVLNFHSSIFVRSDTCRVASGSEKRWLSVRQVSKPLPAAFWRSSSLADPVQVG